MTPPPPPTHLTFTPSPAAALFARLPVPGLRRPVFLLGCGRSGTTILTAALGRHPGITALNEPRRLWASCFPQTDLWSPNPAARGARLALDGGDIRPVPARRLARLFRFETLRTGRPLLVEKTPANNFRIPFLLALFPEARFIYIERDGLEVARSIARQAGWYGDGHDYKWTRLAALAEARPETAGLPARCQSPLTRGLLEWRLSCEAARAGLAGLPAGRVLPLAYETLAAEPGPVLARILAFLALPPSDALFAYAARAIRPNPAPAAPDPRPPEADAIAGALLRAGRPATL